VVDSSGLENRYSKQRIANSCIRPNQEIRSAFFGCPLHDLPRQGLCFGEGKVCGHASLVSSASLRRGSMDL
jgi:hypothetical protein